MSFRRMLKAAFVAAIVLLPAIASVDAQEVPSEWRTFAEASDYRSTPRYAATLEYSRRLADHSPLVVYRSIGKSPEGRDIPLLIASADGHFDPVSARKAGKAVVLVQAGIHSGESDGKDAGLALFRDIAVTGTARGLLRNTVILFVPIYNVDGHEMFGKFNRINQNGPEESGFRANSANQNLNRDYMKADNPETRAWLGLWNEWKPDFFIDCHVTDGADYRYNITWEYARHEEAPDSLKAWMAEHFERKVVLDVERQGHLLSPYLQFADRSDPTKGIFTFIATPRFATGYTALRNRAGLLIEAHSLKAYKPRVLGTYDLLKEMIEEIGQEKASLIEANSAADKAADSRGGRNSAPFPLALSIVREPNRNFDLKGLAIGYADSAASGVKRIVYGPEPKDVTIPWFDETAVSKSVVAPDFYIVPPQWLEVIDRLQAHGVAFSRLENETRTDVESYTFRDPKWATSPFEGRITLRAEAVPVKETRVFPKGSVVIPVAQEASAVAIHLLEPDAPDSLFFWGFFNAIFESKEYAETYALEELAEKMLANDPAIRREFEEMLKDESFANDPRKRLAFFYERSGYKERTGVYPVGRVFGTQIAMSGEKASTAVSSDAR
ncbi:MAG: peptidase M14 [Acidobacteriota bacterium]|nr:MAG: peptidase M14 [Acidobacteriota bacterium]